MRYWKERQFGTPAEMMAVMQTILDKQLNPRICEFLGHTPLAVKHIQHNRWRLIFRWEKAFFQGLELPDVETTIQPVVSYVAGGFFIS